jgi:hypothetical protein
MLKQDFVDFFYVKRRHRQHIILQNEGLGCCFVALNRGRRPRRRSASVWQVPRIFRGIMQDRPQSLKIDGGRHWNAANGYWLKFID